MSSSTLLVIDDDPLQCDLVGALVEDHYEVKKTYSGYEALEVLKTLTQVPEVILCDIVMRYGTGAEFLRLLQQNAKWQSIPIIFMTGNLDNPATAALEELGDQKFLVKPLSKERILGAIKGLS